MELLELDRDRASSIQKHQPNGFKSLAWVCLFFLGFSALLTVQAKAQTLYGSVVGTVTDNTGAAVPGAKVVITGIHTNDSPTVVSGSAGVYTISPVPPGSYQVNITKEGFQGYKTTGIDVTPNNVVRVDAQLSVGAVSQTVEGQ